MSLTSLFFLNPQHQAPCLQEASLLDSLKERHMIKYYMGRGHLIQGGVTNEEAGPEREKNVPKVTLETYEVWWKPHSTSFNKQVQSALKPSVPKALFCCRTSTVRIGRKKEMSL